MFRKYGIIFAVVVLAALAVYAACFTDAPEKLAAIAPVAPHAPVEVALHKAIYRLDMVSVESGAGIVGVKGNMYFEQDDVCDAWTTDQRFTTEYQYPERSPVNNTNHYVAWESKDGKRFEFNSERQENGKLTELLRGNVARADGVTKARYTRPGGLSFNLPKNYFLPTAHTNDIIRHARAGEKIFNAVMFDGTDSDGPVAVTAVIGKQATPEEVKSLLASPSEKIDASLLKTPAWHVRMAVFPLKDEDSLTPAYEMDMILHDNGVVSHALVDYKTFKIEQKLRTIERLPTPKCH